MLQMIELLLLISTWTLFGLNVYGFAFYPTYLIAPLVLFRKIKIRYPRAVPIVIAIVSMLHGISMLYRPSLLTDWVRWMFMILLFAGIMAYGENRIERLYSMIDWSVSILAIYGIFQYLIVLFGFPDNALWLANTVNQFSGLATGAPLDFRDNLRVASLTLEPSYFAFTVGIYYFITRRKLVKKLCIIGGLVSFSQITVYALIGLLFYYLLHRMFRMKLIVFLLLVVAINLIFSKYIYPQLPEDVTIRFYPRYVSLVWFTQMANPVEYIFGLQTIPTISDLDFIHGADFFNRFSPTEDWVGKGLSNIGSLIVNFGLLGVVAYCIFFAELGRYNQFAALALFLYGFNFYYLTAWPSYVIYSYMVYVGCRKECHSGRL